MRVRALLRVLPFLLAGACGASAESGAVRILTVDDPFTGPPAATTLDVEGLGLDGGLSTTFTRAAPLANATIDLGTHATGDVESIRLTARDDQGDPVAWGRSLPLQLEALSGGTLGLFVQRTGTLSRMPIPLAHARETPLGAIVGGRYILVAGGADATLAPQTELYDLVSWGTLGAPPVLTRAPTSLAVAYLQALAIDASGATWLDLTSDTAADATLPTGGGAGGWADVAGGATVTAPDGSSYVVGATRVTGAPTAAILRVTVDATGSAQLAFASLTTPRLGASAAWVAGRGLVVVGGSATAPGVELLGPGATSANALPYPPDARTGAGADALDASHVIVAGGALATSDAGASTATARVIDLACTSGCAPAPWGAALPALPVAQVFAIDSASAFLVGEDGAGAMHAYRSTTTLTQEIPFRIPRNHARALRLPTGHIALVGGDAQMESFVP